MYCISELLEAAMAEGPDPVPELTERLKQLSASPPSDLYHLEPVAGKGIGCIATGPIEKGTLVLRETPQVLMETARGGNFEQYSDIIIKAFQQMSLGDQQAYLNLHN